MEEPSLLFPMQQIVRGVYIQDHLLRRLRMRFHALLRENIREIRATINSLMPEGLEENVSHQEMADLITFILKYQYEVGTESAGIGYGEEVYEEMMLHPSLRPENQATQKGN